MPRRAGRPASRPDGDVEAYVELALWLVEQLERVPPPITRTQIAALIPNGDGSVAVSTVSDWLKGRKNPDPRLVEAVLKERSKHLDTGEQILLTRRAAELQAAADIAEEFESRRRPEPPRAHVAVPRQLSNIHDECRYRIEDETYKRRVAVERARIAEQTITALAQQQALERERLHAQVDDDTSNNDRVRELRLENFELRAQLEQHNTARQQRSTALEAESKAVADLVAERRELISECRTLAEDRERLQLKLVEAERRFSAFEEESAAAAERTRGELAEIEGACLTATAELESLACRQTALHHEIDHLAHSLNAGRSAGIGSVAGGGAGAGTGAPVLNGTAEAAADFTRNGVGGGVAGTAIVGDGSAGNGFVANGFASDGVTADGFAADGFAADGFAPAARPGSGEPVYQQVYETLPYEAPAATPPGHVPYSPDLGDSGSYPASPHDDGPYELDGTNYWYADAGAEAAAGSLSDPGPSPESDTEVLDLRGSDFDRSPDPYSELDAEAAGHPEPDTSQDDASTRWSGRHRRSEGSLDL